MIISLYLWRYKLITPEVCEIRIYGMNRRHFFSLMLRSLKAMNSALGLSEPDFRHGAAVSAFAMDTCHLTLH
jgi:hypothetical protein